MWPLNTPVFQTTVYGFYALFTQIIVLITTTLHEVCS
jgi:hypothetical protein